MVDLDAVRAARERLQGAIAATPCPKSEPLGAACGCELWLKLENLQRTGSFKERGALHKLLRLTPEERARGVVAASAGNHAQGVAFHARRLSIAATIVMPDTTPQVKVAATRAAGARVVLAGTSYDEACEEARRIELAERCTFVHPFDDDEVIAGQGTLGLEILEQVPDLEVCVVPVGGGGLIGGVAAAIKGVRPAVRVVGVESAAFPKMAASRAAGRLVQLAPGRSIAEGIAVKQGGERTFSLIQRHVDELVQVDDEEIASAILALLEREKTVAEGAGAASVAALLQHRATDVQGRRVVAILSGGNIDALRLSHIIERGLARDGRLLRILVTLQDRPGELARLCDLLAAERANVIEIHHDRAFARTQPGDTEVDLTLETRGAEQVEELLPALREKGYRVRREGG